MKAKLISPVASIGYLQQDVNLGCLAQRASWEVYALNRKTPFICTSPLLAMFCLYFVQLRIAKVNLVTGTQDSSTYYSDASRMFKIGEVSEEADRLVRVTKECMEMAIANVKPWIPMGIIGATIQEHAHKNGYTVVRDFGGHGIGVDFHEDPFVFHYGNENDGVLMVPGMTFTIEPMINEGGYELYIDQDNEWTSYTDDGKLSAQWENMILVTEDGCEILTY